MKVMTNNQLHQIPNQMLPSVASVLGKARQQKGAPFDQWPRRRACLLTTRTACLPTYTHCMPDQTAIWDYRVYTRTHGNQLQADLLEQGYTCFTISLSRHRSTFRGCFCTRRQRQGWMNQSKAGSPASLRNKCTTSQQSPRLQGVL